VRDLLTNLRAGLRLSLLRPVGFEDFRCTTDQLVALVVVSVILALLGHWVTTPPPREFNVAGLRAAGFKISMVLLAAHLVARKLTRPGAAIALLVILFSVSPAASIGAAIIDSRPHADPLTFQLLPSYLAVSAPFAVWGFVVCYRAMRLVVGGDARGVLPILLLYVTIAMIPSLLPSERLWQPKEDGEADETATPVRHKAVTWDEAEDVLDAQRRLVRDQDARLLNGRKGVVDLYFVGFASYADQDVFFKEITYARELFDDRFDTRGRSVLLVNHPQTKSSLPLASVTNLRATLVDVGRSIDPDEDIVVVFLASHGGQDHTLSVRNGVLPLHPLTPAVLADALQKAQIRWRVIVVDACYSGGFVDELKNDQTMIMTSASANHTSLGCGDDAEMTYFGRAFLRHGLAQKLSFVDSFQNAASLIARWETAERQSPSEPQIFVGPKLEAKLETLEQRLQATSSTRPKRAASGADTKPRHRSHRRWASGHPG